MKKIAQVGTFNIDNLGDLLFPIVFNEILNEVSELNNEKISLTCFSPNHSKEVIFYEDQLGVTDLLKFSAEEYDSVFIGGGDLIRSDDWSINKIYGETDLSFTSIASPMETNISNLYTLGVGVPFTFDESFGKFIKNSFKRFNTISVRDMRSANILNENGIDNVIVPDIVLSISRYFSKERLTHNFRKIRDLLSIEENSYLVFQANENVIGDEELVSLSEFLNGLSTNLKIPVVMLSIGECLGDNELYHKLKPLVNDLVFINRDSLVGITMIDKVAVLANSAGFIGSSLHGNIISYSYNVPHVTFSGGYSNKLRGFFDLIESQQRCFNNLESLYDRKNEIITYINNHSSQEKENKLKVLINQIIEFVNKSIFNTDINRENNDFSQEVDIIYKSIQSVKTKKEIEISHLWERVNINEYRVKSLTAENSELWKRVNLAEGNLLNQKDRIAELWKRVNSSESNLKKSNDLIQLLYQNERKMVGELDRLVSIEKQYNEVMGNFTSYVSNKIKLRGNKS